MTDYESAQIAIERRKLVVEWIKVLAVFGPLLLVALQLRLHAQTEKATYELRVAELIESSGNPRDALGRIQFLNKLYPEALPDDLNLTVDPDAFAGRDEGERRAFVELYVAHPAERGALLDAWEAVFGDEDEAVARLRKLEGAASEQP